MIICKARRAWELRVYAEQFVWWLAMEFTLGEEGSENIKKIKHNEKSGKIMDLRSMVWMRSIENKITRGGEFKGLEASELEESSMC